MSAGPAHIEIRSVSKRFGGAQALLNVSLEIFTGEIRGLVGENGAGKSTLGKVIAGAIRPDEGEVSVLGRLVSYRSPRDALADGITMIAQEPTLVPTRTIIENVLLGIEPNGLGIVRHGQMRETYEALCDRAGFRLAPRARVSSLRIADQQKVAILQALARDARLIVMDEPTAALTSNEVSRLFGIVRTLSESGTTIVYVSHFLEEVLELADTVTVLKDGQTVRTAPTQAERPETLVAAMLGRSLDVTFPKKSFPPSDAPVVLRTAGLSHPGAIADVTVAVRAGEIVGIAGLVGSGRSELAAAVFGSPPADEGLIELDGRPIKIRSPRHAIRAGIALLPEDRKSKGLLMRRPILENVSLPHLASQSNLGVVRKGSLRRSVLKLAGELDVRMSRLSAPIESLSGGNQQKVLFAKWLFRPPRLLIADEPTRGVDVGAKRSIYHLIASLAANGMAVLLISSELEEVLGLSHRILVMRSGRIVRELDADSTSEDELLRAAFGAEGQAAET